MERFVRSCLAALSKKLEACGEFKAVVKIDRIASEILRFVDWLKVFSEHILPVILFREKLLHCPVVMLHCNICLHELLQGDGEVNGGGGMKVETLRGIKCSLSLFHPSELNADKISRGLIGSPGFHRALDDTVQRDLLYFSNHLKFSHFS